MYSEDRISFLRTLMLVWEHRLDPVDALRYLEQIKEPPKDLSKAKEQFTLADVLDKIAIAHQAGHLRTHSADGRPTHKSVAGLLGMGKPKTNYYWHAYCVERLGLPPYSPPDPDADEVELADGAVPPDERRPS